MPTHFLRSVVFVAVRSGESVRPVGTAVIVGYPSDVPTEGFLYLVTARHNIQNIRQLGGEVCVRLNALDGRAITLEADTGWEFPENEASDIAVLDLEGIPENVLPMSVPRSLFATEELITAYGIGVGDELSVVGLFSRHVGRESILPIVRSGAIASMPTEPLVDATTGLEYMAYLAEVRSIGGLSGSPVYVGISGPQPLPSGDFIEPGRTRFALLGVIRGHWNKAPYELGDFFDGETDSLNTGIAIVTPIVDALEILERPDMVKEREDHLRERSRAIMPTED